MMQFLVQDCLFLRWAFAAAAVHKNHVACQECGLRFCCTIDAPRRTLLDGRILRVLKLELRRFWWSAHVPLSRAQTPPKQHRCIKARGAHVADQSFLRYLL